MSPAQALWLMVSIQLGVFGLVWLAVAAAGHHACQALRRLGAFNLFLGAGLLLVALRGQLPDLCTRVPAEWLVLWGFVTLWCGLRLLNGLPERRLLAFMLGAGLSGGVLALSLSPDLAAWRAALVLSSTAALMLSLVASLTPRFRRTHGAWPSAALSLVAVVLAGMMALRALGGLLWGWPAEVHLGGLDTQLFAYASMAGLSLLNGVLAYLVLREGIARLATVSRRDSLTGLLNQRGLEEALAQSWERWARERRPFALLLIDIDHLGRINASHGRAAGDEVLNRASAVVQHQLRKVDLLARPGGDDLVALLDGEDQLQDLQTVAQRVTEAVREMRLLPGLPALRLSVSIGATPVQMRDGTVDAVLLRADEALYLAKADGRDRCHVLGAAGELEEAFEAPRVERVAR